MKLIILLLFFISCSSTEILNKKDNYMKSIWEIIEKSLENNWNKENLISKLGKPKEQYTHPRKKEYIAWIYFNKKTGFQEWSFTLDKKENIQNVLYIPIEKYRSEFTTEKIMGRWKNLNCKHEKKQELSPGLVKTVTYVTCDNNKRIIKYNRYKEVTSILVKK